jgi:deoxyadenosine/deoxycytidine kinase
MQLQYQLIPAEVLEVAEDKSIRRHEIANRLTKVERRLHRFFAHHQRLVTCVGNIGLGKSSLVKLLAYATGMNALFELPDEGFEDYLVQNESLAPLLATAKESAKRTLGRYYASIDEFIACHSREPAGSAAWTAAKRSVEQGALDIQHAYLDLRKMQLQAVPNLVGSTCVDGSVLADRFAFCQVLHADMEPSYLTAEALAVIDERLQREFKPLVQPSLLVVLEGPIDYLLQNIRERQRSVESKGPDGDIPEGLQRLVNALNPRYAAFVDTLRRTGWYLGPVLRIDVSRIDFVSDVRHLIAVYEGIERLLVPRDFKD